MKIAEPLFPNDDGLADPDLLAALAGGDRYEIVAALGTARVFVALLAELESASRTESGLKIEQESHMSLTWLTKGSAKALPIFTSVASISAWNPAARPLGVEAERAAIVALADGGVAVLDPGGANPHELGVAALRSLALGYPFLPLAKDLAVVTAVSEALASSLGADHGIEFGIGSQSPDLIITLLSGAPIPTQAQLESFANQLASDDRIRLRLEGELEIKLAQR